MGSDLVVRAITADGAFRVIAVRATQTAKDVANAQKAEGPRALLLAEMLTAAVLVRETMAPDLRVQGILQGEDPKTRIVADSFPDGSTRGLVQLRSGADVSLGERSVLQVMRTLHNGQIQQGMVQASASSGISGALMEYMQASEQVVSFAAVGAIANEGDVVTSAGGYIVQLLPEASEGPLMVMTERLKDFPSIHDLLAKGEASPERLLEEVLYGMPFDEVGRGELRFECRCSEERLLATLLSLPRNDVRELVTSIGPGEALEIDCDYCQRHYRIGPERLRGVLDEN
jgi:molecular chaperone Hsp33